MIRRPPELAYALSPLSSARSRGRTEGSTRADHRLEGLYGSAVADRFCAWATRSGRRIIVSVIPLGAETIVANLPLDGGVVLAVRRGTVGRRVEWAERLTDAASLGALTAALSRLAHEGCYELHLHLLAPDAAGQQAVLDDLDYPRLGATHDGEAMRIAS